MRPLLKTVTLTSTIFSLSARGEADEVGSRMRM